jgi:hypothetical protein
LDDNRLDCEFGTPNNGLQGTSALAEGKAEGKGGPVLTSISVHMGHKVKQIIVPLEINVLYHVLTLEPT